jgi:hypothetical protein
MSGFLSGYHASPCLAGRIRTTEQRVAVGPFGHFTATLFFQIHVGWSKIQLNGAFSAFLARFPDVV